VLEQRRTAPSDQLRLERNGSGTHACPHLSRRPLLAHSRSDFRHSWLHMRMCAPVRMAVRELAHSRSHPQMRTHTNHERTYKDTQIHTSYKHISNTMHHTYIRALQTCIHTNTHMHIHTNTLQESPRATPQSSCDPRTSNLHHIRGSTQWKPKL
jgi:hypothetical protein